MGKKDWQRTSKKLVKIYGQPDVNNQPNPVYQPQTEAERLQSEQNYKVMQEKWWNKLFKSEDGN